MRYDFLATGSVRARTAVRLTSTQLEAFAPHIYEVSELGQYLRALLEGDPLLHDVWLRGEVSNYSHSAAGHHYFCLKDDSSQLRCILFRGSAARSPAVPTSGAQMVVHGSMRFYEAQGTCEVVADLVFPEGLGMARMQFEAVHRRLEAEGLFDAARKRSVPDFPRRIGIITSEGGAVIHDLLTVVGRRFPLAEVIFFPCSVQGDGAAAAIAERVRAMSNWSAAADGAALDVLVVARGGGSAEDLATFNDEELVRALYACRVPVVSAVGHETDVTLADLVADVRAPTPSAAAEMITPDLAELRREVASGRERLEQRVAALVADARDEARRSRQRLVAHVAGRLRLAREQVDGRSSQLRALSPDATLARGYAIVESRGRILVDAADAAPGDPLAIRLHVGRLAGTVTAAMPAREPH